MDETLAFGCLGIISIAFLLWGILTRLGYLRASYAVKGNPVLASPVLVFGLIPMGLAMGIFAILPLIPSLSLRGTLVDFVAIPLGVSSIILAMWQPWWIKPKWLHWIEKEHKDILPILWEEVRQEGHAWGRRVRTQEQLEQWVEDVRHKRGI